MRLEVLANAKKSDDEIFEMQSENQEVLAEADYLRYATLSIRLLKFLPSAETVSVLGHYLNDSEGRDGKTLLGENVSNPNDDFTPRQPNAEEAAISIRNLGIEHPPARASGIQVYPGASKEEIDAWRDWWNEVKEGKRTYRFIGSSIEYGPDGPATKEQMEKLAKNRMRAESGRKGTPATDATAGDGVSSKAPLIALVIAGAVLLASLMRYFRRSAKS
jgi:hypothetical protein